MRDRLLRLLERAGLLRPSFRAYEALRALGGGRGRVAADGLPLPPRQLIVRVAGTPDADWFFESGRLAAASIKDLLASNGARIEDAETLLDFGCGCGRVTRHWSDLDTAVHGSDYDRRLVAWCRANLPFARFETNGLAPPLHYGEGTFDVVYALSVLTHLPEELQIAWMSELGRVLRPGGNLVVSTHGKRHAERLSGDERRRFEAGALVVRWERVAGTNLCAAFHPERYVRDWLAAGFDVLDFVPEGAKGNPHQDLYLLRRTS